MRILFLLTGILFTFTGNGQTANDRVLVKKVIVSFQEDFNEGTFKKSINYTTRDWIHVNPLGGITKGREAVLKEVREVHQSFLKGVTMSLESISINFITPVVALADVVHQVDDFQTPDGTKHHNEKHRKTYVVVKKSNKWLLALDHNTIIAN